MSSGDQGGPTEEIEFLFGQLQITVRNTAGTHTARDTVPLAGPRAPAVAAGSQDDPTSSSPASASTRWEVIEPDFVWSRAWEQELLRASTPAQLSRVDISPVQHLLSQLRSKDREWTPHARLARALRAGVSAGHKLSEGGAVESSPSTPFPNTIFVVLRGAPGFDPCVTSEASCYFQVVQDRTTHPVRPFHPHSVSHSFATRTEAEAYVIGARVPWPAPLRVEPSRRRRC